MGDRSGGRESKGTSLKKSKKNPGASAARVKTAAKAPNAGPAMSLPPPPLGSESYFDAGVALLSRQFDRDRDRVIARAKQEDCCGMLVWFADIEKQTAVADHCHTFSGSCYFSTGIHPDNIDRTNKKSHDDWLEKVEELAKRAECLAILSGLNLSREIGTHFAQESLLKSSCALAVRLGLPVVLHINNAASLLRALEILRAEHLLGGADAEDEEEEPAVRILLHDAMTCCESNPEHFAAAAQAGCYFLLAATGLTDASEQFAEVQRRSQACVLQIPLHRLLLCTDSPWKTPQNLPDAYLRTLRNEPSNIASIAASISEALNMDIKELTALIRSNTVQVFGLNADGASPSTAAVPTHAEKAATSEHPAGHPAGAPSSSTAPKKPSKSAPQSTKATASKAYYSCARCRCRLFSGADQKTHSMSATTKTVFKVGEEGLCASTLMFKPESDSAEHSDGGGARAVAIKGSNVECAECGSKVGKFHSGVAVCECGVTVEGPVIKVVASKVDHCDGAVQENLQDLQDLARRAEAESEELQQQDAARAEESERLLQGGPKKEKKKKLKSENKGNFSSYRNKSFIPGASRVGNNAEGSSAGAGSTGTAGAAAAGGEGRRGGRKEKNSLELLEQMVGGSEDSDEEAED